MNDQPVESLKELVDEINNLINKSFIFNRKQAVKTINREMRFHWEQFARDDIRHRIMIDKITSESLFAKIKINMNLSEKHILELSQDVNPGNSNTEFSDNIKNKRRCISLYQLLIAKLTQSDSIKEIDSIITDEKDQIGFLYDQLKQA